MSTQTEPTVKDLIPFGYAPGKYMGGTCRDCSAKLEWVDKLAPRCKECATRRWREKQETKEEVSTQTEQRPLVERLREGCIINPKRWSGDPGEPSPVNESATEELLMEAADEIERLRKIFEEVMEMGRDGGYDYCWRDVYDAAKEALSPTNDKHAE